jgi:hypothetical protein
MLPIGAHAPKSCARSANKLTPLIRTFFWRWPRSTSDLRKEPTNLPASLENTARYRTNSRGGRRGDWIGCNLLHCHLSAYGRYCCKSPKLPGDNFPALGRSDRRPPIYVVSITLPRSPVSLSSGDEAPHIFTRKSHLQPGEFLITSAKRLLQQNRHGAADSGCPLFGR